MLTTVCVNPAFDRTLTLNALHVGEVNRAKASQVDLGGKGLNVASAAGRLGIEARCVLCVGEDSLAQVQSALRQRPEQVQVLTVPGQVRTNIKLVSPDGVTEVNEAGTPLDSVRAEKLADEILSLCAGSAMVALTGSLPPDCPADFYAGLIRRLHTMGIPCALDASGAALSAGLKACPELIKPNAQELSEWTGLAIHTPQEAAQAAMQLVAQGIRTVVVSLGGDGAVLATAAGCFFAPAVPVQVSSTVGAGDCMLAGLIAAMLAGKNPGETLRSGTAAGAAGVMTDGTRLLRREDFERLLPLAQAKRMDSPAQAEWL